MKKRSLRVKEWRGRKRAQGAKAPLLVAGLSNLRPFTGDGAARAGLARAYCHPGAGLSRVRWWRQAVPIPIEAFGLAADVAAAGLEEAWRVGARLILS
jgi:hypothetical protein